MIRDAMIEKLREIQYRLFGPVREQSQADRELDEIIAALAAPVAADPLGQEWVTKVTSDPTPDLAVHGGAVAAEPPSLVQLVQEWQAATAVVRQLNEDGGGEDPLAFSIACELYDRAGDALLAWTPAPAEPPSLVAQHKALRVAVMVAVSDPHLTWEQARQQLTDALNADLGTTPAQAEPPSLAQAFERAKVLPTHDDRVRAVLAACVNALEEAGCACWNEQPCALCVAQKLLSELPAQAEPAAPEAAEAHGYLSRLLVHYAPHCEPLPDLLGVCSQIDNLLTGATFPAALPASSPVAPAEQRCRCGHGSVLHEDGTGACRAIHVLDDEPCHCEEYQP